MLRPDFWQDKSNSKKVIKEKKLYEDLLNTFNNSNLKLKDLDDLKTLAEEENNQSVRDEILKNIEDLHSSVKKK